MAAAAARTAHHIAPQHATTSSFPVTQESLLAVLDAKCTRTGSAPEPSTISVFPARR